MTARTGVWTVTDANRLWRVSMPPFIRQHMSTLAKKALVAATTHDPRWASVIARDPSADGTFFYSVRTTGVYCRPSCAARLARPENVRFHTSCDDAEKAGFRPCKRCKPNQAGLAAKS